MAAPSGPEQLVQSDPRLAQKLAYYKADVSAHVLAPREWFCFGVYGSGGDSLLVSPERIDRDAVFSGDWRSVTGTGIEVDFQYGGTSGRDSVARVIARVFPKYQAFVQQVLEMFERVYPDLSYGPYSTDNLTYKSDRLVEYRTPPNAEGLGTMTSRLRPNGQPIEGFAALVGDMPELNLLLVSVRLSRGMNALTPTIIQELEGEIAKGVPLK